MHLLAPPTIGWLSSRNQWRVKFSVDTNSGPDPAGFGTYTDAAYFDEGEKPTQADAEALALITTEAWVDQVRIASSIEYPEEPTDGDV